MNEREKEQKIADAQWTATRGKNHAYEGTCQRCGRTVPAIDLELKNLPFGRGEQWKCKDKGCPK